MNLARSESPVRLRDSVYDEEIRRQVQRVLCSSHASTVLKERRSDVRHPYPYPIYLTPVGDDADTASGDSVVVLGKHLSERGLDFYHPEPLPFRKVIASLEHDNSWTAMLMNLTWCRFTRHGWYENGGRFLRPVESPLTALPRRQTVPA